MLQAGGLEVAQDLNFVFVGQRYDDLQLGNQFVLQQKVGQVVANERAILVKMVLIARRNCHGKIATKGTCQMFFDFIVPGNGFLAASLRVAPNGMAAAFT